MAPNLNALPPLPRMTRASRPATNACLCGCGGLTSSRFVPGHDSRLRGWVLRVERGQIDINDALITKGERVEILKAIDARDHGRPTATHIPPREGGRAKVDKPKAAKRARKPKATPQAAPEADAGEAAAE